MGRLAPLSRTVSQLHSLGAVGTGDTVGDLILGKRIMQSSPRASQCRVRLRGSLGFQGRKSQGVELAPEDMSVGKHFLGLFQTFLDH